ncbi:MAG: hypothetical protein J3K34DRAFT_524816 [Monoraphidium minutum]|nr:MAG: hypothetical protein J3K34DRAFT_524816 [Monoraphidium minutum]
MAQLVRLSSAFGVGLAPRRCHHARLVGGPARVQRSLLVRAEQEPSTSSKAEQGAAPQAPGEEMPAWVRAEKEREAAAGKKGLPWPLYLVFSCLVAIASVGSFFEYADRNPIFGVVQPDSPLWAPILGLFAITGLPTAGFLFFKGVTAANEAADTQDRIDGYIK